MNIVKIAHEMWTWHMNDVVTGQSETCLHCENCMLQNGMLHNGMLQNGMLHNGMLQNGMLQNGMLQNGVLQNGVLQNGVLQNGVLQNGVLQNGVLQNGVMKGHSRTPSDVEFRELTWRDAKESMHNELYKLLNTAKTERREVSQYVLPR